MRAAAKVCGGSSFVPAWCRSAWEPVAPMGVAERHGARRSRLTLVAGRALRGSRIEIFPRRRPKASLISNMSMSSSVRAGAGQHAPGGGATGRVQHQPWGQVALVSPWRMTRGAGLHAVSSWHKSGDASSRARRSRRPRPTNCRAWWMCLIFTSGYLARIRPRKVRPLASSGTSGELLERGL